MALLCVSMACQSNTAGNQGDPQRNGRTVDSCRAMAAAAAAGGPIDPINGFVDQDLQSLLRPVYECGVIDRDSDDACRWIEPSQLRNCRARWMFFHQARLTPNATNWPALIAPALREDCLSLDGGFAEGTCAAFEEAVRGQHPATCPVEITQPELQGMCVALASSDPQLCPPGSSDCAELAGRLQLLLQGGLEKVATSGTVRDRTHARAALGQKGACENVFNTFVTACSA